MEKLRKLSPRECARVQGFPDSFKINPSLNQSYKQFGNSVAVNVLKAIIKKIYAKEIFSSKEKAYNKANVLRCNKTAPMMVT